MRRSLILPMILFFSLLNATLFFSCPTTVLDPNDSIGKETYKTQTVTVEDIPRGADVYFVFSNVSPDYAPLPVVRQIYPEMSQLQTRTSTVGVNDHIYARVLHDNYSDEMRYAGRGSEAIREANRRLAEEFALVSTTQPGTYRSAVMSTDDSGDDSNGAQEDVVDETEIDFMTFYDGWITVTLRAMTENITTINGERRLRVWVDNDCWHETGDKTHLVTPEMVEMVRDAFLQPGDNNDIYHWVTNIFGAEWGERESSDDLIAPSGIIDIALYDIYDRNETEPTDPEKGGIAGYFWSQHNRKNPKNDSDEDKISNEMIVFALNAVLLAAPDKNNNPGPPNKAEWEPDHFWPRQIIATLAHELQHMVSFYQTLEKGIVETWLDELLSMSVEDIVADKMRADGPRGVQYDNYTAEPSENDRGRLHWFNFFNDDSLTAWGVSDEILRDYAISYAFGAFLTRNFGGAKLLKAIMNNFGNAPETEFGPSVDAVVAGVNNVVSEDISFDFKDLMQYWGRAVLFSDHTSHMDTLPYSRSRYNKGGPFESSLNGFDYKLGSINLFNYKFIPTIFSGDIVSDYTQLNPMSNTYYLAAEEVSVESMIWDIGLPEDVHLTVVVKEPK